MRIAWTWVASVAAMVAVGCQPEDRDMVRFGEPGSEVYRVGDEIVAAGRLFHTGTRVVLWCDPGGYDAYRCHRHFEPAATMPSNPVAPDNPQRYGTRYRLSDEMKSRVADDGWTLDNLRGVVDQFVIHYDACGTSARCFKILQDVRGLSVQFMLDLDGTIYQTLDCKERAWHAGIANDRSVGIEIANIGAYPNTKTLEQWYAMDGQGWPYVTIPGWMEERHLLTPNFKARPSRRELVRGVVNGRELMQYDYTDQQYEALVKLTATLVRVFPNIKLDIPRDANGAVRPEVLSEEEWQAYAGLIGHSHISKGKSDPGPAFDWERVLSGARKILDRNAPGSPTVSLASAS